MIKDRNQRLEKKLVEDINIRKKLAQISWEDRLLLRISKGKLERKRIKRVHINVFDIFKNWYMKSSAKKWR